MEFDFYAIQLKRRGSHVPSIRVGKFPRFDRTPISEREKCRHDSMRFVSSLKVVHIMPASASECGGKNEIDDRMERRTQYRENRLRNEITNNPSVESDSFVEVVFTDDTGKLLF